MFRLCCLTLVSLAVAGLGCNQNAAWRQQQVLAQQQTQAQIAEFERRASGLDASNQDLHSQLAQAQQQSKILQDELTLVRRQLGDTANQLAQSQQMAKEKDEKVQTLLASTQYRGGAVIRPNNSLTADLSKIQIPGVTARQDGDVIRIEIPADMLFHPGTNSLSPNADNVLSQVSSILQRDFPTNKIGVEGHTDNQPVNPPYTSNHQLSASMAQSIFDQLTGRYRLDPSRIVVVGHGSNHPVVSNATPAGQQRNRRVDLVIYAESSN
ncbi:OmpA/MotB family protein [Bremerella cremea]|uniref:OmpA/MotB family protein n=1 Tax=Bremerella cremea TaxID=1031537 RepID=UPI0031E95588